MIRSRRRIAATIALGVVIAILAPIVAVDGIRWRAEVLFLIAVDRIPDLSLKEALFMMRPKIRPYLRPLVEKRNPYIVIENPYTTKADSIAGAQLFRAKCNQCHGDAAQGTTRDLRDGKWHHGATDWNLYRNITRGIEATGMVAQPVAGREAWQIITYIRGSAGELGALAQAPPPSTRQSLSQLRAVDVTRLVRAGHTPRDWPTYSGAYDGWRYSALKQVTAQNIRNLSVRWIFQIPGADKLEASPIVVDGVMFVTKPPGTVMAIDAQTGAPLWSYQHPMTQAVSLCCGQTNRGVAVGGNHVFVVTLDAHLLALDAKTGALVWDAMLAKSADGYSATGVPLFVGNKVVVGIAGGEYGARGFIDAYDAESGRLIWRFHTVPEPGEAGHETWGAESWKTGGAPTWLTGSYDRELDLIYWGVGNPSPVFDGDARPGNNLYSNSVVALDATTGRLQWHFQFTPHDEFDFDSVQIPVLVDRMWHGTVRRLLLWANRNGFYYVLDRKTGEFLLAKPFVKQTWANTTAPSGIPLRMPYVSPTPMGIEVYPSILGGTNWWSPSYSPRTHYFYIPVLEAGGIFHKRENTYQYRAGDLFLGSAHEGANLYGGWTAIRALDVETGALAWDHPFEKASPRHHINGLLSTDGGIVFGSDESDVVGLDAASGKELWRFNTGSPIWAAPVAYEAGGKQVIAVTAGGSVITFDLP